MEWMGYKNYDHEFTTSQLAEFIKESLEDIPVDTVLDGKICYYNIPASFDIEASSFIAGTDGKGEPIKHGTMYIWQLGINGSVLYGRTWEEFGIVLDELVDYLGLNTFKRLIIYVHNLGYEFQWFRKYFEWDKVFAIKKRRPVYAICGGLEFRCSYFLSNYSLEYLGENMLHKYPVKKLVGNLDYYKIRHSKTPLTAEELAYAVNDVRVVMSYIQEKIEHDGDITKIPLTNTGYVRNYCREECFYEDAKTEEDRKRVQMNYKAIMKSLQITSKEEYAQLHRAFAGGFTHASCLYSGKVMFDVGSADLTSSYPYHMCAEYFPMSKCTYIGTIDEDKLFNYYLTKYCCLFDIEFTNLMPNVTFENVLSQSKCQLYGKYVINNGRVVSADRCITTLTELDFDTVRKFYKWDSIKVSNMRIYRRGYLPKPLILAILNMYGDKTTLKGIEGKEVEYLVSKNMINASFGMMVTAIVRDNFEYNDDWYVSSGDTTSQLADYNKNFNRFLFYAWGVWVTAHARHSLFTAIYEFAEDYVYADTDSIKGINFDDHLDYFKKYNNMVFDKLLTMCNHYHIPFKMVKPKTKKGEEKMLGLWDREDGYSRFKTVGAKRYMYEYEKDGKLSLTVSGLNKKYAIPWLLEDNNNNYEIIFEKFGEGMFIPAGHTGKLTMTYIETEMQGTLVDYLGNECEYHELSGIHAEPQSYYMSIIDDYLKFLKGVQYVEI